MYFRPRPIPYALKKAVENEIHRMEREDVLEAVDHSDWVHPVVPVMKSDGSVCLCVDLKVGLNQQVKSVEYKTPTVQGILDTVEHDSTFSKIDISSAFLHVLVEPEHRAYFTINTPL